ncbi:MAG: hypothetical protein WCT28_02920 [Patescibacteria group bacterium]|jgi:hypothetical protein
MSANNYPPIPNGTMVKTTVPNSDMAGGWNELALAERLGRWGKKGTVVEHSDSHGLCYKVMFDDNAVAWFDPQEFELST